MAHTGWSNRTRGSGAGTIGNFTEWYDFAVFGSSSTVLATVFTAGGTDALTRVFAVFAVSFIIRPVGALVVGRLADVLGRRQPLLWMLVLMAAATTAIGLLPTYGAVGAAALVHCCLPGPPRPQLNEVNDLVRASSNQGGPMVKAMPGT